VGSFMLHSNGGATSRCCLNISLSADVTAELCLAPSQNSLQVWGGWTQQLGLYLVLTFTLSAQKLAIRLAGLMLAPSVDLL
jgi:hypothetical protein